MSVHDDQLWTAGAHGDAELDRLETLLARYRHVPLATAHRTVIDAPHRNWHAPAAAAVAMLSVLLAFAGWFGWRLQWSPGAAWDVAEERAARTQLPVGNILETRSGESARLRVARIGTIDVSPRTRVSLLQTRSGEHRIALESGHIRARIWAPPMWFTVKVQGAEIIDLGCEFDLWVDPAGNGRAVVQSGWIMHARGEQETLVPAGYFMHFNEDRAGIPLRNDAGAAFGAAVMKLDLALAAGAADPLSEAAVSQQATPEDMFTLLTLLTRHPSLAEGWLYPTVAEMLSAQPADGRHREAWAQGSTDAINAWWDRVPRPPKQWWRNWHDAWPSRASPTPMQQASLGS
jgi:hypothetical protein